MYTGESGASLEDYRFSIYTETEAYIRDINRVTLVEGSTDNMERL